MDAAYFIHAAWSLALVILLVLLNGFFVAAEFAIVKIRGTQLDALVTKGHRRAGTARRLIRNLDAALSATQLGITLASLGLGWFAEPVFEQLLRPVLVRAGVESEQLQHSISFAVGFSIITFLHIVAGELAPKSLAIQKPLPTTLWVAQPLEWFSRLFRPFIWILNGAALWMLRRVGIEPASEAELHHSEEELRLLLSASRRGDAAAFGRAIVLNAFDLRQRVAREAMRPRQEIVSLSTTASIEDCLEVAERSRFSRLPLCEGGNVDRTLGVVHIKDLYALRAKARTGADLAPVARKIIYVPETARLERLLKMFLDRKLHFAVIVDEYGGTVGMITIENILEELVGQIQDEFDQEKPLLQPAGEGAWELDGALPLHDLAALLGRPLAEEGVTTASGWVTHRLGGFPKPGDTLALEDAELRVEEMDGPRVARLRLVKRPRQAGEGEH